jgi:hypothetical protein
VKGQQQARQLGSKNVSVDDPSLLASDDLDLGPVEHKAGIDRRQVHRLGHISNDLAHLGAIDRPPERDLLILEIHEEPAETVDEEVASP